MIELFQQIADVQPKLPGWCTPEKAATLASLVIAQRPNVTLEIGIYGGSSFIPLALAHKAIGRGMVVGIEPWDKTAAVMAQTTNEDRAWWDAQDLEQIYANFMATLRGLSLENVSRIIRKKSNDADIPPAVGLAHIDGAHNDQAVTDVMRVAQHVEIGGYMVLDDLAWHGGGVTRAAQRLQQMGYKQLYLLGTGAVYQRVR